MRPAGRLVTLVAAATLAGAGSAAAQVEVVFVAPERYTDAQSRYGPGPSLPNTLAELRRLFTGLGARVLGPGQSLTIRVLDVDLAGFERPGANVPFGLRVVTDATPPRLRLSYALRAGARTLLAAEETVTDVNFLLRAGRADASSFVHERALIRDWLQARFAARPRG